MKRTKVDLDNVDEDDLDRQLLISGIGTDTEQLFAALNLSEKEAFKHLANQFYLEENDLEKSVFRSENRSKNIHGNK